MRRNTLMARLGIAAGVVTLLLTMAFSFQIWEQVDADEIVVIQAPMSGELIYHVTSGLKLQKFGKVTSYPKRRTHNFSAPTQFNDGGAGTVYGSIDWIMPLAVEHLKSLHEQFGSADAISQNLIEVTTDKSVYMVGPLLSSTESYAARRTELIRWIEDQIDNGIYQTTTEIMRRTNPLTGEEQTVTVASIRTDPETGVELRQEEAYLASFGIRTANFAVGSIDYDERVQAQIDEQQQNIMRVQTSIAEAREAEQRRITVEQQGRADAAKARAEQEVKKAQAVTLAEQTLAVAELDRQTAEQERQANILRGQGEAERKRLVMNADGALEPKLNAWIQAQQYWAEAFANYKGAMVPAIQNSGDPSSGVPVGINFMEIMGSKAALELALDLSNRPGG